MSLGEVIAKAIADKVVVHIQEQNAALARGEALSQPKKEPFYKKFWALDRVKTSQGQAVFTTFFFLIVVSMMDLALFSLFSLGENGEVMQGYISQFAPSLFIGMGLTALVLATRVAPLWLKAFFFITAAAGGYFVVTAIALYPLIFLLRMPMKESAQDSYEIVYATMDEAEPEQAGDESPEEDAPARLPMGDGEIPDDYIDPLAEFIKRD